MTDLTNAIVLPPGTGAGVALAALAPVMALPMQAYSDAPGHNPISSLLELASGNLKRTGAAGSDTTDEVDSDTLLQVLNLLGKTRRKPVGGAEVLIPGSLKQGLIDVLSALQGAAPVFGAETVASFDLVADLVNSVMQDELLSQSLRDWIRRLEVTLGKESMRRGQLFEGEPSERYALQLLNQLEVLDGAADGRSGLSSSDVRAILTRLIDEWDKREDAFKDAVVEFAPKVDLHKARIERNLARLAQQSEGRARLRKVCRRVLHQIAPMIEGKAIPSVFLDLLNPHWRNVLVTTALQADGRSVEWKQQINLLHTLLKRCSGQPNSNPGRVKEGVSTGALIEGVRTTLVAASGPPVQGVVDRLRALLDGGVAEPLIVVENDALAGMFGWDDVMIDPDPMPPSVDGTERSRWLLSLDKARSLLPGALVKFKSTADGGNEAAMQTLAWKDSDGGIFTFADRRGIWVQDIKLKEFVDALNNQTAVVLEGYDMPVLDRVTHRVMQRVHERITADSQRDDLTQTGNRKSNEKSLLKALEQARLGRGVQCALQIDVDRFQFLNMSFGFDTGDLALREVARATQKLCHQRNADLARIGGDEFALVLFDTDVATAEELADDIISAIRNISLRAGDRQVQLSATVGFLELHPTYSGVAEILSHLAAAYRAGKSEGGDRSFLATIDDDSLREQRDLLELAGNVERYLEEGRVRLNTQLIAPAHENAGHLPHYEVLITVDDDAGKPGSPFRFIQAAEHFGKMIHVDRYVVKEALSFIGQHSEKFSGASGLSINLSGQSIASAEFLVFVLDQFTATEAAPEKVCFEITEPAAVGNIGQALEFMEKFHVMGCRFSLDDFGAGMASFGYLRSMPVDYLKIDGMFVKNMVTDTSDQAVVRSINEIGHFLGKRTVAEYVHDEATFNLAREIGVDYLQGWGIEKPKPIGALLKEGGDVLREAS